VSPALLARAVRYYAGRAAALGVSACLVGILGAAVEDTGSRLGAEHPHPNQCAEGSVVCAPGTVVYAAYLEHHGVQAEGLFAFHGGHRYRLTGAYARDQVDGPSGAVAVLARWWPQGELEIIGLGRVHRSPGKAVVGAGVTAVWLVSAVAFIRSRRG